MDTPESVQMACAGSESAQIGDMYAFIVTDNNIGNITTPGYYKTYLFVEFSGDRCNFSYNLPGGNLIA